MDPNYSSIKEIYADLLIRHKFFFIHARNFFFLSETDITSASLQKTKYLNWEMLIASLVNDSMTKAMPHAFKERKCETKMVFTALVSENLGKLVPDEKAGEEDVHRVFSTHLHVTLYNPLTFGVQNNSAQLAVVGHGRDVANAEYSDWLRKYEILSRMRKPLEKLRPPSATKLLMSNDGDHILKGYLTNFFFFVISVHIPYGGKHGNEHATLLIGDAYYYGRGTERDYDRAADAYMHVKLQLNAQAMFNLGYMHEHGQGLPLDLHLAKRYYDQALETDSAAKLPVMLALSSLWVRRNYANSFLVDIIDSLPSVYPKVDEWIQNVVLEEGNATIITLFVCLLTVLYLRERHRRQAVAAPPNPPPPRPNDNIIY